MNMAKEFSAGIVIVKNNQFLMLRSFSYWESGPKGKVEQGEEPFQAALREAKEETSLTDFNFKWGETYTETEPYGKRKKIARYYIAELLSGEVDLPINPELGKPEHNEFRWATYDEAILLTNERIQKILTWAQDQVNSANKE